LLSGGWYGVSKVVILEYDMSTCEIKEVFKVDMEASLFGEGLTQLVDRESGDRLVYVLTWR